MSDISPLHFFVFFVFALAGTILGVVGMRHRERMAGVRAPRGKAGRADVRQIGAAVEMLTETLERQHERQQALERRLAALERTPDAMNPPIAALSLPEDDAAVAEAATEPVRARVRA